ncbi:polysaccharide biosynthesis/export family protein [Boseongicola aestuarii]|uniref:Polysaccharide biosynthesis/export protein n=1 Tax=Boseongicola aestuarii TaxID=1470561 RepID=A0A238J4A2_9RHOB|nr:polysaccharide biosynthesis/export family protein [Boseongicola aestuarii]SMX24734.1 Polysaccharide biosynthesis/export protein [Boseongicola aestuarii]
MRAKSKRRARFVALCVATTLVAGCALPRSGPTKNEIFSGAVQRQGDSFVVTVDDQVTAATAFVPALGFAEGLTSAAALGSDIIRPGDTLGLTIWENVEDGLLASASAGGSALEEIQVDGAGMIFVPYAGRIRAAGNSTEAVRRIITEKLEAQTPDPQVVIRRMAGDGATVSLIGGVGAQGVYAIERPNRTLTAMLATAGGITLPPEITQITLIRGAHKGTIWLQDLYSEPQLDVALRGGDRILVEEDTRFFTALGATGAQQKVPFDTQSISAIEALARVGGLSTGIADPTGIFIFRNEPQDIASAVLGRDDLIGPQRMIYVLDLTSPNGVFIARDFAIRDADTVYVTEAPYTQFSKVLSAVLGPLQTASSIDQLIE